MDQSTCITVNILYHICGLELQCNSTFVVEHIEGYISVLGLVSPLSLQPVGIGGYY